MNRLVILFVVFVMLGGSAAFWIPQALIAAGGEADSSCIACHANVKKLIKLGWKIEAERPKSLKSSETSGEG